jgi:hypothetical protein
VVIQPYRWQHDRDGFKGKPQTRRRACICLGNPAGPKPQNLLNVPPPKNLLIVHTISFFVILSCINQCYNFNICNNTIYYSLIVLHSFICHLRGRSPKNPTLSLKNVKKNPTQSLKRAKPEGSYLAIRYKILRFSQHDTIGDVSF